MRRATATALLACALVAGAAPAVAQDRAELLRIPFPQDDGSLTPYTFELGYPLVTLVYDTVMWRDGRGVPRPWLARSVRRSPDGRRLIVRLRRGVQWHDGRPLTALDVAFTLRFVATHPHPRFTPQLRDVERVEATSRDTVVIELSRPSLGFLDQPLSDLPILPRHLWAGLPADRLAPPGPPVGSGPYRLTEHRTGRRYGFRANPGYFRGPPRVQRIEVPVIRTAARTLDALERREVDMLPASLSSEDARRLEGIGARVARGPSYLGTVLMFNTTRPPFDRLAARRAVARALDPTRIARAMGDLGARAAVPAVRGYLHPASPWAADRSLHRHEPDAARVAFAELGLPPIRVLAPRNDPVRLEAGRQVVLALRQVGARAALAAVSPERLARAVGQDAPTSTFELAIWSAPGLASEDPAFLRAVFGEQSASEAPLNYSGYRSPAFERAADRVDAALTEAERRRAVGAELEELANDLPVVPLFFAEGAYAYRPAAYDGWSFVKGTGILDKRSFVRESARGGEPAGETRGERSASDDPLDRSGSDRSPLPFAPIALAIALVLAVAFAWRTVGVLLSRKRTRR